MEILSGRGRSIKTGVLAALIVTFPAPSSGTSLVSRSSRMEYQRVIMLWIRQYGAPEYWLEGYPAC